MRCFASTYLVLFLPFVLFLSQPSYGMNVGECANTQDISAFLRAQKHVPVAGMNVATIELDMPDGLRQTKTANGQSKANYEWLWTYQRALANFDAVVRTSNLDDTGALRARDVLEKLRDLQLKKGAVKEIETGHSAWMLTGKTDLSQWYLLQGNRPVGEDISEYCLVFSGKAAGVYDYQNITSNDNNTYHFNRKQASEACLGQKGDFFYRCRPYSVIVDALKNEGYRLAFHGIRLAPIVDNTVNDQGLLSIFIHPGTKKLSIILTSSQGATIPTYHGVDFLFFETVTETFKK